MKIAKKKGFRQISLNYLSDIDFKDILDLYKNCTAKPFFFLMNDTTLASNNIFHFRKNLLERI